MSRYVEVHGDEVARETDRAVLCRIDGDERWIPLSQIDPGTPASEGGCEFTMGITRWIAEQKGLL